MKDEMETIEIILNASARGLKIICSIKRTDYLYPINRSVQVAESKFSKPYLLL